jgi:hypothetical protein
VLITISRRGDFLQVRLNGAAQGEQIQVKLVEIAFKSAESAGVSPRE